MDIDEFWYLIEGARTGTGTGTPFHEVLTGQLASRGEPEILDFQERFEEARRGIFRWDVWAAAYLIGDGCSDDGFLDFTAGIIAQGRGWYQKVLASPDNLADHPAVTGAGSGAGPGLLSYKLLSNERVNYVASFAYARAAGDEYAYGEAREARGTYGKGDLSQSVMGEDFDFDDDEQMRQRLPRLAAIYLG